MKYVLLNCLFFPIISFAQKDTLFYSIIHKDTLVGKQLIWTERIGENQYVFQFDQSGFKKKLHSIIQFSEGSGIVFHKVQGEDLSRKKVHEEFKVEGKYARWINEVENDSAVNIGAFYFSINNIPGESELMLAAMKRSPDQSVNLLPSGKRQFEKLDEVSVSSFIGEAIQVELYRFTGYGDYPRYYWFTKDGKFFAELDSWLSTIHKGFEKNISPLYNQQKEKEADYYLNLARKTMISRDSLIAIVGVNVFNSKKGVTVPNQTVLIAGKKIRKIAPAGKLIVPKEYYKVDGKGKFLMAGLWESHAHVWDFLGPSWLAHGVTNVRDMGSTGGILELQRKSRLDSVFGPDITIISGFIDKVGSAPNTGVSIQSLEEGIAAIKRYKEQGYDQIKIYDGVEPNWLPALIGEAHKLDMRVAGHLHQLISADEAIDMGYDEITHVAFVLKNFLVDKNNKETYKVPRLVSLRGGSIDLGSTEVASFVRKLKLKGTVIDPTLSYYERVYTHLPGRIAKAYEPVKDILPPDLRRSAWSSWYRGGDSAIERYAATYENMVKLVKLLHERGVPVLAGTDGLLLQHELEIYSAAGIPNNEVLQMATYTPASVHKKDHLYGNVAEGLIANLILVDGDPVKNMSDIRKISLVLKNGKAYDAKKILREYGWKL